MSVEALQGRIWYRVRATVKNLRATPNMPPTYFVVQAILKKVQSQLQAQEPGLTPPTLLFRIPNRPIGFKVEQGATFPLEVLLFPQDLASMYAWMQRFLFTLMLDPSQHHTLPEPPEVEERTFERVWAEWGANLPEEGELCLDFLTPLSFETPPDADRTFLAKESFVRMLERRVQRLLGVALPYTSETDDFRLLACYWHYTELRRPSASQAGTEHYIKGCVGPLYLKGRFRNLLPLLVLGAEFHVGSKLTYGLGYYRIKAEPVPYFAGRYPTESALCSALYEVREGYDLFTESPESVQALWSREGDYGRMLCEALRSGAYQPTPTRAFVVASPGGGERIVEQLEPTDLVVQVSLLRLLETPFERLLESPTRGYRAGRSRERAIEAIRAALAEGFQFAVETDIEDFFACVEHDRLQAVLESVLPRADAPILELVMRCVRAPFRLPKGGKEQVHERTRGLAHGSPLSPLLANLYLDAFEEEIQASGARLIRYGDTLFILTRTREEAEQVLQRMHAALHALGLRLKPDKSAIKPIADGFESLGIAFRGTEVVVLPEPEPYRLRKPLYITEPYLALGVQGNQVRITRKGRLVQAIPLARLSEIVLMEPATLSTALVRQCVQANIPITLTLGTGYYLTTIKPDSQAYHSLSYQHGARYDSLAPAERLAIAQAIVDAKLQNYLTLFRRRYVRGAAHTLHQLEAYRAQVGPAGDLDALRGIEGRAARLIYTHLNTLIHEPAFHLKGRIRRPPDPINSLLNLSYYLLFSRLNALLRSMGLNPYLGFLHSPHDRFESLVADLQEPFRALMDRIVVKVVNLRIITPDDFETSERGAYLTREARKRFLEHYERELCRPYPPNDLPLHEHLYQQALAVKRWVTEGASLTFYRWE
ncbi:MAG: CRISPR-associated endonuclease Cas1 [Fimbriimonadales bacterium]|nr:CRISPR-associated endonuclease Cas1 [Fimbriimonadales bacterium]